MTELRSCKAVLSKVVVLSAELLSQTQLSFKVGQSSLKTSPAGKACSAAACRDLAWSSG